MQVTVLVTLSARGQKANYRGDSSLRRGVWERCAPCALPECSTDPEESVSKYFSLFPGILLFRGLTTIRHDATTILLPTILRYYSSSTLFPFSKRIANIKKNREEIRPKNSGV